MTITLAKAQGAKSLPTPKATAVKAPTTKRSALKTALRESLRPYLGEGPTAEDLAAVTLHPTQTPSLTLGFAACGQLPYTMPDGSIRTLQCNIQAWIVGSKGTTLPDVEPHRVALAAFDAAEKASKAKASK